MRFFTKKYPKTGATGAQILLLTNDESNRLLVEIPKSNKYFRLLEKIVMATLAELQGQYAQEAQEAMRKFRQGVDALESGNFDPKAFPEGAQRNFMTMLKNRMEESSYDHQTEKDPAKE